MLVISGTILLIATVGVFAATLGAWCARRFGRAHRGRGRADHRFAERDAELLDQIRDLTAAQEASASGARDAAVSAALEQLATMHRSLSEQERQIGTTALAGERQLIDQRMSGVSNELARLGELMRDLERDRESKFGQLSSELRRQHEGVTALTATTGRLTEVLANPQARGQWGERMADDVLRLAGFVEGVNYRRQQGAERSSGRPDYTFLLPNDLVLHMDVKFPLDNYVRCLEANGDIERRRLQDQFIRDVRDRVRELTTRDYLNGDGTVDCLLMFIPNEAVYGFVAQHGSDVLDDALRHGIVVCSPLTLYAVLAVIRQSVEQFQLERTSSEILSLLADFTTQWEKFACALDGQQRRFDTLAREFSTLTGTRRRALEQPLDRIDALRRAHDLEIEETAQAPLHPVALEG